jgi:hypothetical protein
MKKLAILSAAALIGLGAVASTQAEAAPRRGAAVAAGVIGGLAAGALIGAAASNAYASPYYGGYGYGYPAYGYAPAYSYGYAPAYQPVYVAPQRVYRTRRVVRTYDPYYYRSRPAVSIGFGFGSPGYWGW